MSLLYASRMMVYRRDGYEEGISIGLERGLATGREEGAYQKALETARAFLAEGLSPAMVARCTDLPLETIQELVQEI